MIHITPTIAIKENEIKFDFIRASGPGGQNVNKVATAVQLRFDAKIHLPFPMMSATALFALPAEELLNTEFSL
jgi:ribosome-associated protein